MTFNLPNSLTWFRILAIPLVVVLYYLPVTWAHPAAGWMFALAGITDSLDGYLAPRKRPEPEKRPPGLLAAVWDAVASPLTTSGVPMRVYAAPFKGKGKDANVEIAVEIAATKLNLVEEAGASASVSLGTSTCLVTPGRGSTARVA